jgi:hypothetical protein
MRWAGRLDVQLEVGELSFITNGLGVKSKALLPLEHIPAGARDLLSSIYQRGFVTEKLFWYRSQAGGEYRALVGL